MSPLIVCTICLLMKVSFIKSAMMQGPSYRDFRASLVKEMNDLASEVGSLRTVNGISELQCTAECANTRDCSSLLYNIESGVCQMHQTRLTNSSDQVHQQDGSRYYLLQAEPTCPQSAVIKGYTYYKKLSLCYKIVTDNIDWDDASTICKYDGGHLMLVNNQDVNSWLVDIFSTAYSVYEKLHIDGNDKLVNGVFKNYRNEVMEWTAWTNGEPNDFGGNEDCIALSKFHGYKWIDIPCSSFSETGKLYICEVDTEP